MGGRYVRADSQQSLIYMPGFHANYKPLMWISSYVAPSHTAHPVGSSFFDIFCILSVWYWKNYIHITHLSYRRSHWTWFPKSSIFEIRAKILNISYELPDAQNSKNSHMDAYVIIKTWVCIQKSWFLIPLNVHMSYFKILNVTSWWGGWGGATD